VGQQGMQYATFNPAVALKPPHKEAVVTEIYDLETVKHLLVEIRGHWMEVPVVLACIYGVRAGEACGLKFSDVDFERKTVTIHGVIYMEKENSKTGVPVYRDAPKTQMGRRIFKLSDEMEVYFRETQARIAEERLRGGNSYDHTWDGFMSVKPDGNIIHPDKVARDFKYFLKQHNFPIILKMVRV